MDSSKIYTWAKFTIHPGQAEEFRRLAAECSRVVNEQEPGTLFYEWFMKGDDSECVAIDCYTGFDALMTHVQNIGPLMRQILAIADRQLEMYGADPSARLAGRGTASSSDFYAPLFLGKL